MQRTTLSAALLVMFVAAATAANAASSFTRGSINYAVGATPVAVVAADLDGDGKIDLVTANNDTGDVSVLIGDGHGNFMDAVSYSIGSADLAGPSAIAVGDMNGDTKPDIVVADELSSLVAVLLNQGGGVFGTAIVTDTGTEPEALVVADFNGDGHLDVATADFLDDTVTVLMGTNDGRFSSPVQAVPVESSPSGLAAADFDADGHIDLMVANSAGGPGASGTLTVLKGSADGTLTAQTPSITAAALDVPVALAAGNLNHDTKIDVVAVNEEGDSVAVLLGNGDLTFQPATQYDVGATPEGVVLADLDGDGNLDIASSGSFDDNVTVLMGTGDGAFLPGRNFAVGSSPTGIASADLNGDAKRDLVVVNADDSTVTVLLNTTVSVTAANAAATGATTLVLIDAGALPRAGALQTANGQINYRSKTGNTLNLGAPLAQPIDQGARITLLGALGDCDESGQVTADDLMIMASVASGGADVTDCALGDNNQDGRITVDEVLTAVNIAAESSTP